MEPSNDAEKVETHGEVVADHSPPSQMPESENYPASLCHDGKYIQYDIFGSVFEVTAKYKPPIGKGAYGFVCSVTNSETNEKVAIKKILNVFENNMEAKRTLREIKILRHLNDHENIIGIKDIILPYEKHSFEEVYIAYELMDTDLYQLLTYKDQLCEDHHQYFLYQILRGLKYIHSANVIHRDLKPSNLLLSLQCDLKICDFGLARAVSESHSMTEYVVTRWYRAPELILNSSVYTSAIDVWSVGCIFLEMVNREPLFPGNDQAHQLRLIMELVGTPTEEDLGALNETAKQYLRQVPPLPRQSFSEKFPNVPPLAIDLMEKMLQFDPRQRISVEEALAHPYLSSMHESRDEPVCAVPFNFDLEEHPLTSEQIRELIYNEALAFNPEKEPSLPPDKSS